MIGDSLRVSLGTQVPGSVEPQSTSLRHEGSRCPEAKVRLANKRLDRVLSRRKD
jgi:N-methylhydantoinase B/oxoprolinase/acetone carboxylase alpha subunit